MKTEDLDPLTRTLHATASSMGHKTDPDVLEAVRVLNKKIAASNAHLGKLGRDQIAGIYAAQLEHGIANAEAGTPGSPQSSGSYRSKKQIDEDLSAERRIVKEGLIVLHQQLIALVRPEAVRFVEDALEMIAALEESEQGVAQDFAITYVESNTLKKLREAIGTVVGRDDICWEPL